MAINDYICVCYVLPYTLSDIDLSISQFKSKLQPDVYFDRRVFCQSYEGRDCEIITVTMAARDELTENC